MLNEIMILLAKYLYLLIIFVGIVFLALRFKSNKKDVAWLTMISLPAILIVAKISGHVFYDPRPFVSGHFIPLVKHVADNGFPSDHALLSFAIASVVLAFNKKLGFVLFGLGFLVGVSRVYVGIHSPIDIIGSFVISVLITYLIFNFFLLRFHKAVKDN